MTIERRTLLAFLLSTALAGGTVVLSPQFALAKDGGGDDGGGNDSGDDSGGDDSGGDDGGGNDNGDDSGDDGGHDNDGGGDDNGKGDDGKDGKNDIDQDDALEAMKSGKIISLEKAFAIVNNKYDAKIIDVKLSRNFGRPIYGLKLRLRTGQIKSVRIDARTGKLVGFLGL